MEKEYKYVNLILLILGIIGIMTPCFIKLPNDSATIKFVELPECFVKVETGKLCPSCGLTKSIVYIYRGDLSKSKTFHPFGFLFFIWLMLQLIIRILLTFKISELIAFIDVAQLLIFILIFKYLII